MEPVNNFRKYEAEIEKIMENYLRDTLTGLAVDDMATPVDAAEVAMSLSEAIKQQVKRQGASGLQDRLSGHHLSAVGPGSGECQ